MGTTTTSRSASARTRKAVLAALAGGAEMTAVQVAETAGIGRSTATSTLAALTTDGQLARTAGGRDGARRLPDRWTLHGAPPAALSATTPPPAALSAMTRGPRTVRTAASTAPSPEPSTARRAAGAGRLASGELAGQVLAFLREHPGQHSPTAIAAGLGGRSGGAVSNALARLTDRGEARLTQDRPRRYAAANA